MSIRLKEHIEKITALTDEEFALILSHFTPKQYKKHQFVVQQDEPVHYEYFVVKGLLKSYFISREGKEHILQFAMEDWWITDYLAFMNRSMATCNVDCIEDVSLLALSFENKAKLCAASHKMEHFFRVKATSGFVAQQQRVLSFMNNDTQARYRQLFEQYPTLFQRVPKAMIAAYLGVSRETLSRLSILK
jgi:CRP-like cAMP-binding protein